jgi:hypothetical protein
MAKKILQIRKGEYLLEIRGNAVATTYNQDIALDISGWKLDQVGYIVSNLKKVGYTKAEILTIEEEVVEENTEETKE